MRTIALANQKGGVGKTTAAIHLAHGLALAGQRTALFDLDPQGNATVALQAMAIEGEDELDGPLSHLRPLADRFWLLPSPGAERNIRRDARLDTDALVRLATSLEDHLDWILVDCPPRMDQWGWAGLRLCQDVLVPVQPEFFAMHGLSHMLRTLDEAGQEFPGRSRLLGVLVNMLDPRESIAQEVQADLRARLSGELFETTILRDPKLVEAASHGTTLFRYDLRSKGARCYAELVREVMYGRTSTR